MSRLILVLLSACLVSGCAATPAASASASSETERNRAIVRDFARLFYDVKDVHRAFETYVAEDYIQHNPGLPDGREAAVGPLARMFSNPEFHAEIRKLVVDGELAVIHLRVTSPGAPRGASVVDMYRLKDGKIFEHWDVIQLVPEKSANPHPMF